MTRRALPICFSLLALTLAPAALFAGGPPPPPGWGKPPALPPANGVGKLAFQQGTAQVDLPLQKIEIEKSPRGGYLVSLEFVDAKQKNRGQLHFMLLALKPGAVSDNQITGLLFSTPAGGESKGNIGKTKCKLVLSQATAKAMAGTASCEPMFRMDATTKAPAVKNIKFAATAK